MSAISHSIDKKGKLKEVKSILISQPKPNHSPYFEIEQEYNLQIDWRQFIQVEPVSARDFRRMKIKLEEYTVVIFTSKNSIIHFFRICEEMKYKVPADLKYYCLSEAIANYLQKFIVYRKRKVFIGKRRIEDLKSSFDKHAKTETYLLPCSNLGAKPVVDYLNTLGVTFKDSVMYQTVASNLSDLEEVTYDMLVFFSPLGIKSLFDNFPDFKQNDTRIAVFGSSTEKAVIESGLEVNVKAPSPEAPSMSIALKNYLELSNA